MSIVTVRFTRGSVLARWKLYTNIRLNVPRVGMIVDEQLIVNESNFRAVLLVSLGGEPKKLSFLQCFLRVIIRYTYIRSLQLLTILKDFHLFVEIKKS